MKKIILIMLLLAISIVMVTTVSADAPPTYSYEKNGISYEMSTAALGNAQSVGALRAPQAIHQSSFDSADGYVAGACDGQNGWTMFAASTTQGHISTVNPSAGDQHMRIDKDTAAASGSLTGCFSPDLGAPPAGTSSVKVDIAISATGGADYDVVPQAPSEALLTARVKFNSVGDILILDDTGGGLIFVDSGANWTVGSYETLEILIDPVGNTIDYIYGGATIYSSVAGLFGATTVEQVVLLSDNFQTTDSGDFDSLSFTNGGDVLSVGLSTVAATNATASMAFFMAFILLTMGSALLIKGRR